MVRVVTSIPKLDRLLLELLTMSWYFIAQLLAGVLLVMGLVVKLSQILHQLGKIPSVD